VSIGVRGRLTLSYAGALAVVLVVYAALVLAFARAALYRRLDHEVFDHIQAAEQLLERTDSGVRWRASHHDSEGASTRHLFIDIYDVDGRLQCREPTGTEALLPFEAAESPPHTVGIGDETFRVMTKRVPLEGAPVWIRAARNEAAVRGELASLLALLGVGIPIGVAAAGLGGYFLARRALAPVAAMAERARSISAERLHERLPVGDAADELGRLARVFNETLDRLERSFEELRRFTADASHELRTPLTALRTVGEVALRGDLDAAAARDVIGSMLEETDRLARLIDSLLTLSRADAGRVQLHSEPTDLAELAREVSGQLRVLAEEKRQTLEVDATGAVVASVDRLVLRQAVVNLVDNAIKYGPACSSIRVEVRHHRQGGATIAVRDEGPGIAPEHQGRVFDRFYRVDKGRSRSEGGVGLGLAIAKWAVEANGGKIELTSEVGRGSTFTITVPA
jgi:heavy metal sensor kinase